MKKAKKSRRTFLRGLAAVLSSVMILSSMPIMGNAIEYVENNVTSQVSFSQPNATPAEVAFTIAGDDKQYVLLDSVDDENSAYFILTDFAVCNQPTYVNQKWDPTISDQGERAVWLNKASAETLGINEKLYNSIDRNHVWYTENGAYDGPAPTGYTFTAGITVPSLGEIKQYASKIRYSPDFDWGMLRTGSVANKDNMLRTTWDGFIANDLPVPANGDVRPCFWINEDFFKTVKLDLGKTGEDVKEAIRNTYKPSELAALYTAEEITSLGYTTGIYDLTYTNGVSEISSLQEAGNSLTASATVVNSESVTKPVTMIVAVYNANGGMEKAVMNSITVGADTETPLSVTVDMTGLTPSIGWKAITFVWDNVVDMTPLCNPYDLPY